MTIPGKALIPGGGCLTAAFAPPPTDFRSVHKSEAFLDSEAAGGPLRVRSRWHGDCISPLGMSGSKKLQDVFVDAKVPRLERERIPVVTRADGELLWVAGLCVSRAAAVTPKTMRSVHLIWERKTPATSRSGIPAATRRS